MISLPPIEEAFLVKIATSLVPLVFAPSELVPTGRMYIVHRGLALLRRRWLGLGQMWGLEMLLQEQYTQQYAASAVSHLEVFCIDRPSLLSIASGYEHTAVIAQDGSLYTWGNADFGKLGVARTGVVRTPTRAGSAGGLAALTEGLAATGVACSA